MSDNISLPIKSGSLSTLGKIPWTLVIILYMVIAYYTGLNMDGIAGYIFLGLCMAVLFIEFFKSGDINAAGFLLDLSSAVLSLIIATVLMCYLYLAPDQDNPTFFHWFGCLVILGDAILSPFNSFRTALRNFGLGGSS
jgi:hypothetical protein